MSMIGNKRIGSDSPTFVVAEMAWSHDGSMQKGRAIVDAASAANADAINFHLTSLKDYMVPFYGDGPGRVSGGNDVLEVYKYLDDINLSFEAFAELAAHAKASGLAVSIMCNDEVSATFAAKNIDLDMIMIHPSAAGDERLLRQVASVGRPLVIYTGGLRLGEVENSVEWAVSEGNSDLILQHGFQSYPTALEDNHLRAISTLKRQFGFPVAFADHTDGEDPMAIVVPLMAIAMGADVVEKHITHDRAAKGEDYESAFGPPEFKLFVERVRQAELTLGLENWRPLSERQLHYRSVVRKRAVAAQAIPAGTVLTRDLVAFKRCDTGLFPEEIVGLFGHVTTASSLEINAPLVWELFK